MSTDVHHPEGHPAEGHHDEVGVKAYLLVFAALAVFTAVSFVVYELFERGAVVAFLIILAVAVVKATLVAAYFMHLVVDWRKVLMAILPALVLLPLLLIVLWPDIVLDPWHQ